VDDFSGFRRAALLEANMADLKRKAEQARHSGAVTRRVGARGAIIILMVVLMVGMIAWWVH
jgi:hypothetical protein